MASNTDVRAGRAFVELGTNESKLIKGLRRALKRVRGFADNASAVGTRFTLFGAGAAGGLIAITKGVRDTGAAMDRLRTTTGLGSLALAGLEKAAADNDVSFSQMDTALVKLANNLGKGGAEVERALGRIGLSVEAVRKMSPEDVISTIADRLPALATESDRVSTAMALMGRNGAALIPVLQNGSKGLNDAAKAAQESGMAMDDAALDAAVRLDGAFNGLTSSTMGLRNSIGVALEGAIGPYVDGIAKVITGIGAWIKENPELVRSILNVSLAAGVLGAGVVALALAFLAATSPIGLTIALLVGLVSTALAVTDTLGITETGFGDLFNSIRIGGQGLGTWFSKFFIFLQAGWAGIVTAALNAGSGIFQALIWVPRALLMAFRKMVDGMNSVLSGLAEAWNSTVGQIAGELSVGQIGTGTVDRWIENLESKQDDLAEGRGDRRSAFNKRIQELRGNLRQLNKADPDDGSAFGFDSGRAKGAFVKIGDTIGEKVKGALADLTLEGFTVKNANPFGSTNPFERPAIASSLDVATSTAAKASGVDVLGTFNASIASRLGFGSSLEERKAKAAESTARNTREILREIQTGQGGVVLA